jgi:glutaredoxin
MKTLTISSCETCPFMKRIDEDWDYKASAYCEKSKKYIQKERVDFRWNKILDSIAPFCEL